MAILSLEDASKLYDRFATDPDSLTEEERSDVLDTLKDYVRIFDHVGSSIAGLVEPMVAAIASVYESIPEEVKEAARAAQEKKENS